MNVLRLVTNYWARIYFTFLKTILKKPEMLLLASFNLSEYIGIAVIK